MKNCFILLVLLSNVSLLLAHSGGQDSKGGHHDRINGGYHYHHGHSAHQHPDGKCELIKKETASGIIPGINTTNKNNSSNVNIWLVGILGVGAGYLINNMRKK